MVIARLGIPILAAIASLTAGAARAADYSPPQPPQPMIIQQQPEIFSEGWYLRGNIGLGINNAYKVEYLPAPANVGNGFVFDQNSNADTFFIGGGIGYNFNSWLRFDGTAEYRGRTQGNARG